MNPTAGSFTINPRLQRHFATFAVSFPSQDALFTIYNSILSDHLDAPANKFPFLLRKLCQNVVNATLALHMKSSQVFREEFRAKVKINFILLVYFYIYFMIIIFTLFCIPGLHANGSQVSLPFQFARSVQRVPRAFVCNK